MLKSIVTTVAGIMSLICLTSCKDYSEARPPGSFPNGNTSKMAKILRDGERNNLLITGKHRAGDIAQKGDGHFQHDGSSLYSVHADSFRKGRMQGGRKGEDYIIEITTLDRRHLRLTQVQEAVLFDDAGNVIWASDEKSRALVESVFDTGLREAANQVDAMPDPNVTPGDAIPEQPTDGKPGVLKEIGDKMRERIPSIFDRDGNLTPETT